MHEQPHADTTADAEPARVYRIDIRYAPASLTDPDPWTARVTRLSDEQPVLVTFAESHEAALERGRDWIAAQLTHGEATTVYVDDDGNLVSAP